MSNRVKVRVGVRISERIEFNVLVNTLVLVILENSLSRQSLALVLTTQNRQEKIHQKHKK